MRVDAVNVVKTFKLRDGVFNAVDGISLHLKDGDRVGIIGRNGAGKSTFLSILAGLQEATSGTVDIEGKVDCILALGSSMSDKLTGRQNIYRDGEMRGVPRDETDAIAGKIIEYADIGSYIDNPVGTYSSGMRARLAFAMMVFIDPGILIIDEALSVGDAEFGQKASATMKGICAKGKILILVSHSMPAIRDMCSRVIWIEAGKVVEDGSPEVVIDHYLDFLRKCEERELDQMLLSEQKRSGSGDRVRIDGITPLDGNGLQRRIFATGDDIVVQVAFRADAKLLNIRLRAYIEKSDGNEIWSTISPPVDLVAGANMSRIVLEKCELGTDVYECYVEILGSEGGNALTSASAVFKVQDDRHNYDAVVHHDVAWDSGRVQQ